MKNSKSDNQIFTLKSALKFLFFNEKKHPKRFWWLLMQKIHYESPILALCDLAAKLGTATRDTYNQGG